MKEKELKVLFISSGNNSISSLVLDQGNSLEKCGVKVTYFPIVGKGVTGYIRNVFKLRRFLNQHYHEFDIFHAHFSWSAIVATLAGIKTLVVSLMGSDVKANLFRLFIVRFLCKRIWTSVIVKSDQLYEKLGKLKSLQVIPNGVDFTLFKPLERSKALKRTGWDPAKKHILFAARPQHAVKNYALALKAFQVLDKNRFEMHVLNDIEHNKVIYYYNSADIILLTSKYEGSVNVIKEAMACNRPIVTTDVGDVRLTIGNTEGCEIVNGEPDTIARAIFSLSKVFSSTNGRENIKHLNSEVIAIRLKELYLQLVKRHFENNRIKY